jgi:hypothetical protein
MTLAADCAAALYRNTAAEIVGPILPGLIVIQFS